MKRYVCWYHVPIWVNAETEEEAVRTARDLIGDKSSVEHLYGADPDEIECAGEVDEDGELIPSPPCWMCGRPKSAHKEDDYAADGSCCY